MRQRREEEWLGSGAGEELRCATVLYHLVAARVLM